jgi:hypothetical protein
VSAPRFKVRIDGRTVRTTDDAFTRRNGSIVSVSYSAAPLMSGTSVAGVVVVFRDKTAELAEQTRAQREFNFVRDLLTNHASNLGRPAPLTRSREASKAG